MKLSSITPVFNARCPPPSLLIVCCSTADTAQQRDRGCAIQLLQFRIFNERLRDRERSGDVGRCADRQQRRAPVGGVGVGGRSVVSVGALRNIEVERKGGSVGRDLVGRATTWTRGDPDKVTRPTSAELENLLRILIEYKGSAFLMFYSRKKVLLISMVFQFWRSQFFSKIS